MAWNITSQKQLKSERRTTTVLDLGLYSARMQSAVEGVAFFLALW